MRVLALAIVIAAGCASGALASSSTWYETEGVRLRLVTSGRADADGTLKGALQIELKPGWKTYWRDPGASGVPPSIDVSGSPGVTRLDIGYPAPMRFNDESGPWTGYKHSVTFPVTLRLASSDAVAPITAEVFIGVCETVCVPVQARLSVHPAADPDNPDDAAAIEAAQLALSGPAEPDFGATLLSSDETQIQVAATFPGNADAAELFIAGVDGYVLGTPEKAAPDGKATFTIPVLERPAEKPHGEGLPYTLVTQAGAVDGFLPYP